MIRARLAPLVGLGLGALACLAIARPAHAYVRYKTEVGMIGFYWPQSWIPVTAYPQSIKDVNGGMEMTADEIMTAATAAAGAWSGTQNACTYLQVNVSPSDGEAPLARYDARNSLVFRTMTWCPYDASMGCYDPSALAITSVFVNKKDGRIRDADIEVNAKNFNWTDLDLDPDPQGKQDLQNALAHEMGHLIGLDHTCFPADAPGPVPTDNEGNPAPDCDTAPEAVRATTMFASAIPGDKEKRTLAPDDIQAVCEIYPLADDPKIYVTGQEEPPGCTCAVDGHDGGPATAIGAVGILAALVLRRRARAR